MKRIITLFSLTALMAMPFLGSAQEKHCGTAERLRELYAKDPQLERDQEAFLKNCTRKVTGTTRDGSDTTYIDLTIPIVFHIVHEYGSENITDAQVISQVDILNRDYHRLNADTINVHPAFDTLIGKANITFKLANIDPQGNCTNGINHYYSHETRNGDDFSKLNGWPRASYLNVWVVKSMRDGVAGYAYYPSAVPSLPMAVFDGIIILHDYIGNTGTGNNYKSRALTHEIGHWLSLPHTWGSTNEPEVECGDDGIADTPVTKGHSASSSTTTCTTADLNDMTCTPGVIENVQNYMEYAYCSIMFTPGQVYAMRMALASNISNRNHLWTEDNLAATGTDGTPVLCSPVPDMFPNQKYVCMGDAVTFTNKSWRGTPTSYSWSFPGGTPATSTLANPTVTYNTFGWHDVTLTVTNAAGTETRTFPKAVMVSNPWTEFTGTYSEGFEGTSANWWLVDNPENNEAAWNRVSFGAASGSYCFRLNNHKETDIFSYLYFNQLGGNIDALISPSYDLSHVSSATLSFKYSCATHATTLADQTEVLNVYSSTNCGKTWVLRTPGGIKNAELVNAGIVSGEYIPTSSALWTTKTITLVSSLMQPNVRFKFEYTASDYSNNIYIDDINLNGIVGVAEVEAEDFELNVYPNPSTAGAGVNVSFMSSDRAPMQLVVNDVVGKTVYTTTVAAGSGKVTHFIGTDQLSKGIYTVNLSNGEYKQTVKVVIQ